MARIELIDPDKDPANSDLVKRIRGQRRGKFLNIYKLLLHSPTLAEAWFNFNNAVRWGIKIDGRLREIVIIRIAILNGSEYTLRQHTGELADAEGLSSKECDAIKNWQKADNFNSRERAALAATDAMTQNVSIPDKTFEPLRKHFSEREILELAVLIGSYNMHTRTFQALQADLETN
jgi:4-carboxymuconolactone decarboxylase